MQQLPHIVNARDCYNGSETLLKKTEARLSWTKNSPKQTDNIVNETAEVFSSHIQIPITNFSSDKKMFLPTFYSCLIAKTYQLHLTINIASATLKLVLPVQLAMEEQKTLLWRWLSVSGKQRPIKLLLTPSTCPNWRTPSRIFKRNCSRPLRRRVPNSLRTQRLSRKHQLRCR